MLWIRNIQKQEYFFKVLSLPPLEGWGEERMETKISIHLIMKKLSCPNSSLTGRQSITDYITDFLKLSF